MLEPRRDPIPGPPGGEAPRSLFASGSGFSLGFVDATRTASRDEPDSGSASEAPPVSFILRELIGVGGQGEVWEAWQPTLQRTVAVKIHHSGSAERFAREALLTGELEHPAIVPVLEFGTLSRGAAAPAAVAMVMKRLRGKRWDVLLAEDAPPGVVPPLGVLRRHFALFDSVCQAVAFAHSRGVLHLDIKPSQVIVGEFGETSLCDWGMAARVQNGTGALEFVSPPTGSFGTPAYMAPEQALGDIEAISFRTDTYLLSALAFHILTGAPPHPGESVEALVQAARRNELRPMPKGVPASLRRVVLRGLSAAPAERFAAVAELREAVTDALRRLEQEAEARALCREASALLDAGPMPRTYAQLSDAEQKLDRAIVLAPRDEEAAAVRDRALRLHAELAIAGGDLALARVLVDRMRSGATRDEAAAQVDGAREALATREAQRLRARRVALAALGALVGVLVISSAVLLVAFQRAGRERERAEAALEESRRELARASLQAALSYLDKSRPTDAREALRHVPPEWRGWEWGFLASRAAPELRLLRPRGERYGALALSADGSLLAALCAESCGLQLIPTEEGAAALLSDASEAWSTLGAGPGDAIVAGASGGAVGLFHRSGKRERFRAGSANILHVAASEGAVYAADADGAVWRLGADGAEALLPAGTDRVALLAASRQNVAVGMKSGAVWHGTSGGALVKSAAAHSAPVRGLAWDPSGSRVVSWAGAFGVAGQADSRAVVHAAGSAEPLFVTLATDFPLTAAGWSSDGKLLRISFANAWLHELEAGGQWGVRRSIFHDVGVADAIRSTADGRMIVLMARALFQVRETEWLGQHMVLRGDSRTVLAHAMHGDRLYLCGEDGGIGEWRLDQSPDSSRFVLHPDQVRSLDAAEGAPVVAAAHRWGWVYNWDITGAPVRGAGLSSDLEASQLRLSSDGSRVAAISEDGRVQITARGTGEVLTALRLERPLAALALHPNGRSAVVAPRAGGLLRIPADQAAPPEELPAAAGPWSALEFSPSGAFLFAAETGGTIRLLNPNTGMAPVRALGGHRGPVRRLGFDASGRWLLSAGEDETARLWDAERGSLAGTYRGSHAGAVVSALLTPDGKRVLTACEDALLRVFERHSGVELAAFEAHQFGVLDMVPAPDGRRVVTTGLDATVRVWSPLPWDAGDSVLEQDPFVHRPQRPPAP